MFPTPRIVSVWKNRERHGHPFLRLFKDIDSHLHLGNCLTFLFKYCSHRVLCSGQNYFYHSSKMLQRHYFADKGPSRQSYGFPSSHVWMWELDSKESWVAKNWCFWTVVLEKTLENPLDCKEIQPVHPKGNQSWISLEGLMLKLKFQYFGNDPDAGNDWRQEEKGTTEDEMVDGITDSMDVWVNSGSWWWTGRPGVLQSMGSQRVRHDSVTKLNWTETLKAILGIRDALWYLPFHFTSFLYLFHNALQFIQVVKNDRTSFLV